jgi:hypothetical protein
MHFTSASAVICIFRLSRKTQLVNYTIVIALFSSEITIHIIHIIKETPMI